MSGTNRIDEVDTAVTSTAKGTALSPHAKLGIRMFDAIVQSVESEVGPDGMLEVLHGAGLALAGALSAFGTQHAASSYLTWLAARALDVERDLPSASVN